MNIKVLSLGLLSCYLLLSCNKEDNNEVNTESYSIVEMSNQSQNSIFIDGLELFPQNNDASSNEDDTIEEKAVKLSGYKWIGSAGNTTFKNLMHDTFNYTGSGTSKILTVDHDNIYDSEENDHAGYIGSTRNGDCKKVIDKLYFQFPTGIWYANNNRANSGIKTAYDCCTESTYSAARTKSNGQLQILFKADIRYDDNSYCDRNWDRWSTNWFRMIVN